MIRDCPFGKMTFAVSFAIEFSNWKLKLSLTENLKLGNRGTDPEEINYDAIVSNISKIYLFYE